jgi:hypothetical protein
MSKKAKNYTLKSLAQKIKKKKFTLCKSFKNVQKRGYPTNFVKVLAEKLL